MISGVGSGRPPHVMSLPNFLLTLAAGLAPLVGAAFAKEGALLLVVVFFLVPKVGAPAFRA